MTAAMSWFFPGAHPISQWSHAVVGIALLGFALWGVWRPRIAITAGQLVERPGVAPRHLALAEVADLIPVPQTGHRPSEADLDRLLGVRLRNGDHRWIDLRWIRSADRDRLRACVAAAASPG